MEMYKCGSCGAELEITENSNMCVCSYCGSKTYIEINPLKKEMPVNVESAVEFAMQIDSVFSLTGRGTAVTGCIDFGEIHVNDSVRVISDNGSEISCTVAEIEQFRKKLSSAKKNEHAGLILSGVSGQQIKKGNIIIKGKLDIEALNRKITSSYTPKDKIRAIDCYRKATGLGLKAAKDKVDNLLQGNF